MSCTLPICTLCFTKPYMHIKLKLICELSVFNPYQIGNGFKRNQPFLNMYFIVLNTNTESVSSEYTPDTKKSNFTFHNKCPVCPYRQKDQQGHPMFQPATQDSSLIV